MDDTARLGLRVKAKAIEQFMGVGSFRKRMDLSSAESGSAVQYRDAGIDSGKPLTFEEIADEMDMNQNTITQKLNALIDGGYSGLTLTQTTAFSWTGRHRKLARHNKKELIEQFTGLFEKAND